MTRFLPKLFLPLTLIAAASACNPAGNQGPVDVAIFAESEDLFQPGLRLGTAGQHMRAATNEGLVALDPTGQVIPAIAERWIVTDDGSSYIFRLRDSTWPDGEEITAADVRTLLQSAIARLEGTSLGLDLAKVVEVRAMTGRVIEMRLSGPMPDFLRLLAQPELGFVHDGAGAGPMIASREEETGIARLSARPPQSRGLPEREDWEELARGLTVRGLAGEDAVDAFTSGTVDLLLNGRIATFPLAQLGPLSRGTVQVDPALGLFGLIFRNDDGVLAEPANREAISMAIERLELIQPFGLGGWRETSWIVPHDLFVPQIYPDSRWSELSPEQKIAEARRRIARWEQANGEEAEITIGLPDGPGAVLLFRQLAKAWREIGLSARRLPPGQGADLELRDRLARYSSPRWYLNQFNCSLEIGLCSPEADDLVSASLSLSDPIEKQALLAEAHAELMRAEVFVPLGAPVRWSLVRGAVDGYRANQWGIHPLFPLTQPAN